MNIVIAIASFILGGIFGMAIMCCVVIGDEKRDGKSEKGI